MPGARLPRHQARGEEVWEAPLPRTRQGQGAHQGGADEDAHRSGEPAGNEDDDINIDVDINNDHDHVHV